MIQKIEFDEDTELFDKVMKKYDIIAVETRTHRYIQLEAESEEEARRLVCEGDAESDDEAFESLEITDIEEVKP